MATSEYARERLAAIKREQQAERAVAKARAARARQKRLRESPAGQRALAARMLKHRHGLTPEAYEALHASQGGCCAVCREPIGLAYGNTVRLRESGRGPRKGIARIDHDRATGIVRGLLCGSCNNALGLFRDSVSTLQRAVDYLRAHGATA